MSQSLNFPERVPPLAAGSLTLREMTEEDVPAWFERASDPESSRLSGDPIPRADFVEGNAASKRVLEKLGFRFHHGIADYRNATRGYLYVLRKPDLIGIDQ